jgi:hypothetical protein
MSIREAMLISAKENKHAKTTSTNFTVFASQKVSLPSCIIVPWTKLLSLQFFLAT